MASISQRKGKFKTTYMASVCVQGRRLAATFDTKSEAHRWAEDTEYLMRTGQPLPNGFILNDMTIKDAVEKYTLAVAKEKKPNTRRLDQEIGGRIIKYFSGKTLLSLRPIDIAAYRDYRMQSVGSSSVIQDMSFISCMYRMARVDWGLEVNNPEKDVRRPSAPKNRLVLLTREQIDRLLDYCCVSKNQKLYCYVFLLLHTAMRPSEGAGLRWDQILWDYRMLDLTETKTDPRRVPLTKNAFNLLQSLYEQRDLKNPFVFLPKSEGYNETRTSRYFRRAFDNAARYAQIDDFTLYGLRHSAASYLIMSGIDIRTVAEIMGHKNINQTMKYTHFFDSHKLTAIDVLDRIGSS